MTIYLRFPLKINTVIIKISRINFLLTNWWTPPTCTYLKLRNGFTMSSKNSSLSWQLHAVIAPLLHHTIPWCVIHTPLYWSFSGVYYTRSTGQRDFVWMMGEAKLWLACNNFGSFWNLLLGKYAKQRKVWVPVRAPFQHRGQGQLRQPGRAGWLCPALPPFLWEGHAVK